MHDLRINSVFAARNAHQTCIVSNIDTILKKVSQEHGRPTPSMLLSSTISLYHHTPLTVDQESAIFPAVKALLANSTPPSH